MARKQSREIEELRRLSGAEQAEFAVTLLSPRSGLQAVQAALAVLAEQPQPSARPALFELYRHYDEHGGSRDPGTYTRSAIVRALRPLLAPGDAPFLTRAVSTYEFPAPDFTEDGSLLRSAALLALLDLGEESVTLHATRLLADEHTHLMSGEPALTAVRVLAASGELAPLYFYVSQPTGSMRTEVASECLRNLTPLPVELLPELIHRLGEADEPLLQVGLFDLLIRHERGPQGLGYLYDAVQQRGNLDAYRYLVTTLVAAGNEALLELLVDAAPGQEDASRVAILLEALEMVAETHPDAVPELGATIATLSRR